MESITGVLWLCCLFLAVAGQIPCDEDRECPSNLYCYKVSRRCVEYTTCLRYNRVEGDQRAREATQCGPCLSGYSAEILASGSEAQFCTKSVAAGHTSFETSSEFIAPAVFVIAVIIIVSAVLVTRLRKVEIRMTDEIESGKGVPGGSCHPAERSSSADSFVMSDDKHIFTTITCVKSNDHLVTAVPYKTPSWVQSNLDYEDELDFAGGITESLSFTEEDTSESSWTPGDTLIAVPSRPFAQFSTEQRDNQVNDALAVRSTTSESPVLEDGSCEGSAADTVSDATPTESGDHQGSRQRNRIPTIAISQKIEVHVTVLEGDC